MPSPRDFSPHPVDALLAQVKFTNLCTDWLPAREAALGSRLAAMDLGGRDRKILLLNATRHQQLYPSVVDFFAALQKTHPRVAVTSASYFDDIFDLGRGVAEKGLRTVRVDEVRAWPVSELNRFDLILAVGPSHAMVQLSAMPGLTTKLVCLDLAFYHQLIEFSDGKFLRSEVCVDYGTTGHRNKVVCYSTQPERKVVSDLERAGFELEHFEWRWLDYIPIGYRYGRFYRSDKHLFDIALLGTSGRDYAEIDPAAWKGLRIVFIGNLDGAPDLARLKDELDLTVMSRLDDDRYARLIATCRSVVIPCPPGSDNVLLSLDDALATGKALITSRHIGIERLAKKDAPIVYYRSASHDGRAMPDKNVAATEPLSVTVQRVLADGATMESLGHRAIAFAQEHLDIYRMLEILVREQLP